MFARLKETYRVLSYRAPVVHGPDAVIIPARNPEDAPAFGKFVAFLIEAGICVYGVGYVAGHVGSAFFHAHPSEHFSLTTVVGILGAVLFWLGHSLLIEVQKALKKYLNLGQTLSPYFGHKVHDTYRTIRG